MSFPWTDPQFWTVTVVAAWGLWTLVRQVRPSKDEAACGGCASGAAARSKADGGLVQLGR